MLPGYHGSERARPPTDATVPAGILPSTAVRQLEREAK
jgi:hypothetical protein